MNQGYAEACGITALYARTAQAHVATHVLRLAQNELEGEGMRLNPQDAIVYYNRGVSYGGLGQYERAIQDYDEAIRLNPQDAEGYYNRGLAYDYLGKRIESERDIKKAKELGYVP